MLSTKHSVTYRVWLHHGDGETLVIWSLTCNTDTALADWTCSWLRQKWWSCIKSSIKAESVFSSILDLTEFENELVDFNTGWSFLGWRIAPALFLLHSRCSSCCLPGLRCQLKDPGVNAGAPRCATCRSQSRSGSLCKVQVFEIIILHMKHWRVYGM